jgi:hypothetical protein
LTVFFAKFAPNPAGYDVAAFTAVTCFAMSTSRAKMPKLASANDTTVAWARAAQSISPRTRSRGNWRMRLWVADPQSQNAAVGTSPARSPGSVERRLEVRVEQAGEERGRHCVKVRHALSIRSAHHLAVDAG